MKKYIYILFNFFLINSFFYRTYLNFTKNIKFIGIQNFNPISTKQKLTQTLLKIEDNYFSKKESSSIPIQMHSFDWLNEFKSTGGINFLKKSRNLILDWNDCKYKLSTDVWKNILVARRIINLSVTFDFYGSSADKNFQKKITDLISFHFKHLVITTRLHPEKNDLDIEISKSLLLTSNIFGNKNIFSYIINLIKNQTENQINADGFHKSINIFEQAKFIHQLIEIKNILLFYNYDGWLEIDSIIIDMLSLLKNFFHKDLSLPLFNATNNTKRNYVMHIANLQKDIKIKKLLNIRDGIVVVDANKTRLFFDITKPNSKLLNKKIHSGTLSFEMSHGNEKIITNCGSPEKYLGKNQVFFRYSAAHSTITINNTNVSELSENSGYRRIPKSIKNSSEDLEDYFIISGSHDGYKKNYGLLVKRTLKISKNGDSLFGIDQILSLKNNNKNNSFEIRFHLMPDCACLMTNNDQQVIIKTKSGLAWYFKSINNKVKIDESLYIGSGDYPVSTKQIILFGNSNKIKNIIEWNLNKII